MKQEITALVKNRYSECDFKKIDFEEPINSMFFYGNHPVKKLPLTNDDFLTYVFKYYQCHIEETKVNFEQKNVRVDFYRDKYHIVDYINLKSEEKELFDSIVNDPYFKEKVFKDMNHEFEMRELRIATGL